MKQGKALVGCWNCGLPEVPSKTFDQFLRILDPNLHFSMLKEKLSLNKAWEKPKEEEPPEPTDAHIFNTLKTIEDLSESHPARIYVKSRKIPEEFYSYLRYAPKFKKWTNRFLPGKFEPIKYEEPRLVIPVIDKIGTVGWYGRSFDPNSEAKYISIMIDKSRSRAFGLDRVDITKPHYVLEGPIDSLFLPDCIAAGTSSLHTVANKNSILCGDNQARNPEIVKITKKNIEMGYPVVIWPDDWPHKDINDAVLAGMSRQEILEIIKANTYKDNMARLKFAQWSKI